ARAVVGAGAVNLRSYAQGRACLVRIPGVCNGIRETTVLAHARLAGITGVGQKAPDVIGAHACSACHDVIAGRRKSSNWTAEEVRLMFYEGILRTLDLLCRDGVLRW